MNNEPKNFAVTGYSGGGGKTFLLKNKIMPLLENSHQFAISHTTREKRLGEIEGLDYFFISRDDFLRKISRGEFLEYSTPREGEYYGTSIEEYQRIISSGKKVIFDIDCFGIKQLREKEIPLFVLALLPKSSIREEWMLKRGDGHKKVFERIIYSEKTEKPFFDKKENSFLFDIKNERYDENTNLDFLVNRIQNEIFYPSVIT